jgi:hypothetical protein
MVSEWPNYTGDDLRQIVKATRDWYSPMTVEFLKTRSHQLGLVDLERWFLIRDRVEAVDLGLL